VTDTAVSVRRAPRFGTFVVAGALLGVVVALILTLSFEVDPAVGFASTFGFFALFGIVAGIAIGAVVALLLDAVSRRRARSVDAQLTSVEAPPLDGELED
jgi:MFS family permease